MKKENKRP